MGHKKTRRSFDREFKLQAVRLVTQEGRTQTEVSRNLDIGKSLIGRWIREFKEEGGEAFPGKGKLTPQDEELRKLREELRRVTMERDILKKATAYFAQLSK